jgi:hypothetical protein
MINIQELIIIPIHKNIQLYTSGLGVKLAIAIHNFCSKNNKKKGAKIEK